MSLKRIYLLLGMGLMATASWAQSSTGMATTMNDVYCGGITTTRTLRHDSYVISGVQSDLKIVFTQGDLVFINRGAKQGVKVGDQFLVSRPETDLIRYQWFEGQDLMMQQMGNYIADLGRLRVVDVQEKTSTAQVIHACEYLQRDDIIEPFEERPSPAIKTTPLDIFAPPNNKAKGTIAFSSNFGEVVGSGSIVYINLGAKQGVKVGDYFRVFHYQGDSKELTANYSGTAYEMYGLGSTPKPYGAKDLPRDILGEGVVLRVSPTTAAVLITNSLREIYVGSYVELE